MYGSIAARWAGVPAVVNLLTGLGHVFTADNIKALVMRRVAEEGCRAGLKHPNQRVIFQNPDDQALFVNGGVAPLPNCRIIRGSGVDVSFFDVTPEPLGAPIVVLPSRMLWDKGVREFVAAAELLRARGVHAKLVLVGGADSGNPTAIPIEQLRRWTESQVVEWWGHRKDMNSIFAQCHIVCLPSYREGVPKALLEAAAGGRPIVTTNVPGCREVVEDGLNGLLVPPRNEVALASALEALISDRDLRKRMGSAGRELAVKEFSLDHVISQTLAVYDEVLSTEVQAARCA
jgi:glycosyltransferase involved in cell wall biosynthesis